MTRTEADKQWDSSFSVTIQNTNRAIVSAKHGDASVDIPLFALATVKRAVRVLFYSSSETDVFYEDDYVRPS
jgi:hypothetical protein